MYVVLVVMQREIAVVHNQLTIPWCFLIVMGRDLARVRDVAIIVVIQTDYLTEERTVKLMLLLGPLMLLMLLMQDIRWHKRSLTSS